MIETLDWAEREAIKCALQQVRCCKILKSRGYNIGSYKLQPVDDLAFNAMIFGNHVLEILEANDQISTSFKSVHDYPECEESLMIEYFDDKDFLMEVKLIDPAIINARKSDKVDEFQFYELAEKVLTIDMNYMQDNTYYDWVLPCSADDGIIYVMTDANFVDVNFVENYFKLKDYCEGVLKSV